MRKNLISSHIDRANKSINSFERYKALWSAFNVMYEGTRKELINIGQKNPSERQMAEYCACLLDYEEWKLLLESEKIFPLLNIAPIFNERDWVREAKKNTRDFTKLVNSVKQNFTGTPAIDKVKLEALVDLLYVIRCNLLHGFKTPDGPRDREVLDAACPLLHELVIKLKTKFL